MENYKESSGVSVGCTSARVRLTHKGVVVDINHARIVASLREKVLDVTIFIYAMEDASSAKLSQITWARYHRYWWRSTITPSLLWFGCQD